jgi:hypothetical protein
MSDVSWPLQTSTFAMLSPLMAPVLVYDQVAPAGAVPPYVVIGDQTSDEEGDKTQDAERVTLTLHVFSRSSSRKEVKELAAKVKKSLHRKVLTPTGFDPITLFWEFGTDFLEEETMTKHAVIRFGALITTV